jgi:hypothetical protein
MVITRLALKGEKHDFLLFANVAAMAM